MIPWLASEGTMRPKQHTTTGSGDLFRARLDQIINLKHELVQLAGNPSVCTALWNFWACS